MQAHLGPHGRCGTPGRHGRGRWGAAQGGAHAVRREHAARLALALRPARRQAQPAAAAPPPVLRPAPPGLQVLVLVVVLLLLSVPVMLMMAAHLLRRGFAAAPLAAPAAPLQCVVDAAAAVLGEGRDRALKGRLLLLWQ